MNDGKKERGSFGTFAVVVDDLTVGFHPFLRLFLTEKGMPLPWSGEEYVQQVQPRRDDAAFQPLLFSTVYGRDGNMYPKLEYPTIFIRYKNGYEKFSILAVC